MCGIVGYTGYKNATEFLINGLKRLEYRGYDSAGISLLKEDKIITIKQKGRIKKLEGLLENERSKTGIGHTRWATHGAPSKANSHPHNNEENTISVVHNGIIENYEGLKEFLKKEGYSFISETDSEVIPKLIDYYYKEDLLSAVIKATEKLKGSYAIGIISSSEPDKIIAIRKDSPLIIGTGKDGNYIASDVSALSDRAEKVYFLDNNEFAVLTPNKITVWDSSENEIEKQLHKIDFRTEKMKKNGYEHYMLKEIFEQPEVIADTLKEQSDFSSFFDKLSSVYIVACGTAYHAGLIGKKCLEKFAGLRCETDIASEFRYRNPILKKDTGLIVVSQSGETADTIAALRMAKKKGARVLAITNVKESTVAREADFVFFTKSGPEISVAATKTFTAQLTAFYKIAIDWGWVSNKIKDDEYTNLTEELNSIPFLVKEMLNKKEATETLAHSLSKEKDIYYLGRGFDYPVALEGSLKLKEISYIHSEAYPGGELKHGPIALIENGTKVIIINTDKSLSDKMESNSKEVVSRGADLICIGFSSKDALVSIEIPKVSYYFTPFLTVVPLQLIAYYTSVINGYDVDKPRNLAKSVTVE